MYINVNASVELRTFVRSYRECTQVTALHCDHEEADTRMLPHAKHASRDAPRIVIQSPDTDVLLLCVTHNDEIQCDELWFRSGVKDRLRYIPAHKIAAGVGPLMCKVKKPFICRSARKVSGRKTIRSKHCESQLL